MKGCSIRSFKNKPQICDLVAACNLNLTLADQETPSRCSKDDRTVRNACRDTQRESPGAAEEEEEASQHAGRGDERHGPQIQKVESEERQGERCHEQCKVEGCGCRVCGVRV